MTKSVMYEPIAPSEMQNFFRPNSMIGKIFHWIINGEYIRLIRNGPAVYMIYSKIHCYYLYSIIQQLFHNALPDISISTSY